MTRGTAFMETPWGEVREPYKLCWKIHEKYPNHGLIWDEFPQGYVMGLKVNWKIDSNDFWVPDSWLFKEICNGINLNIYWDIPPNTGLPAKNRVIRTGASWKKTSVHKNGLISGDELEYLMSSWAPWFLKAMNSSKTSFSAPGRSGMVVVPNPESRLANILRECQ